MASFAITLPDGAVLKGAQRGAGRDLLLISGLGGTGAFWHPVVDALAARFRLTVFDQRGIGASTRGDAPCTIATLAADAAVLVEELGLSDVVAIGHSTGGCIVQELALAHPGRIAGIVLSGAWGRPSRYMRELFRSRLALLEAAPREYAAQAAFLSYDPDWLDANWPRFDAALRDAPATPGARRIVAERIAALLAYDRRAELSRIGLPTTVIGAEDDLIVPAFLQRELVGLMPGADLAMLPRGGHFFPVTRTAEFVTAIEPRLRS